MWSLYENEKILPPRVFSNGKSQEDVVKEVVDEIKKGRKVIFIHGVCGSGKSAIALHIAKELGRASIVVPVKDLQRQYGQDYTNKKYLLKDNGEKLKISMITGRKNHNCPFKGNCDCDNAYLPCKIEIKEKNRDLLRRYVKMNPYLRRTEFDNIKDVRRFSIAPSCPYWSPILPAEFDVKLLDDAKRKKYAGLKDVDYEIYKRKEGCKYYDQFDAYIESDVIIFNSYKYKIESVMNRKPNTDVEIIDECDEFLDSLANQATISLNRLYTSLGGILSDDKSVAEKVSKITSIVEKIMRANETKELAKQEKILKLSETDIFELLNLFLDKDLMEEIEKDEMNYCNHVVEAAMNFESFFDDTYVSYVLDEGFMHVQIVTTSLEKKMAELIEKNKALVFMSGTIHSPAVLRDIFGLSDFKIIEAEDGNIGQMTKQRTGFELDCSYSNLRNGEANRSKYLKALSKCVELAKKPILVHVNSFYDLPSEIEKMIYGLKNLVSRDRLREMQDSLNEGRNINEFKEGKIDVLFSTKCNRGMDFPGEQCNSIIFTKYPNPDIQDIFWKILKLTKPQHFWNFYRDKASREFLQRIYRGLRFKDDHIFLLSPDIRVLNAMIGMGNQKLF